MDFCDEESKLMHCIFAAGLP